MSVTLKDLCEKLKNEYEMDLIDLLGISSEDIVNRFEDVIESKYDSLVQYYEEKEETFGDWSELF